MNERKKKKKTRFSLNILNVDPQFNIHVSCRYRIEIEMNGSPLARLTIHINLINSSPTVLLFEYHLFRE